MSQLLIVCERIFEMMLLLLGKCSSNWLNMYFISCHHLHLLWLLILSYFLWRWFFLLYLFLIYIFLIYFLLRFWCFLLDRFFSCNLFVLFNLFLFIFFSVSFLLSNQTQLVLLLLYLFFQLFFGLVPINLSLFSLAQLFWFNCLFRFSLFNDCFLFNWFFDFLNDILLFVFFHFNI